MGFHIEYLCVNGNIIACNYVLFVCICNYNAAITFINYDIVWRKAKLQGFTDDLQGMIDVMMTFKLSDNLLIPSDNAENTIDSINESNE